MSLPFASGASRSSRPFAARFPGICENCGDGFEKGDEVMYDDDELVHADPDDCVRVSDYKPPLACTECNLVHAGGCF